MNHFRIGTMRVVDAEESRDFEILQDEHDRAVRRRLEAIRKRAELEANTLPKNVEAGRVYSNFFYVQD